MRSSRVPKREFQAILNPTAWDHAHLQNDSDITLVLLFRSSVLISSITHLGHVQTKTQHILCLNVLGVIALNMFKRFNNETCLDTLWINPSQHHSAECKFSTNNSSHL